MIYLIISIFCPVVIVHCDEIGQIISLRLFHAADQPFRSPDRRGVVTALHIRYQLFSSASLSDKTNGCSAPVMIARLTTRQKNVVRTCPAVTLVMTFRRFCPGRIEEGYSPRQVRGNMESQRKSISVKGATL